MASGLVIVLLIISWAIFLFIFDKWQKKQLKLLSKNYNPNDDKGRKRTGEFDRANIPTSIGKEFPPRPAQPQEQGVLQATEPNVDGENSKGNRANSRKIGELKGFIRKFGRNSKRNKE